MKAARFARLSLVAATLAASGCASTADDVTASSVPMTRYQAFQCQQLASEFDKVSAEAASLSAQIDRNAVTERIKMGVGVVLFWPALMLMDGETEHHRRLASLKGERLTLANSMKARNCPVNARQARLVADSPDPV